MNPSPRPFGNSLFPIALDYSMAMQTRLLVSAFAVLSVYLSHEFVHASPWDQWQKNFFQSDHHLKSIPAPTFDDRFKTFNQLVDHNNPLNSGTFNQRYFIDDESYQKPGGPVLCTETLTI